MANADFGTVHESYACAFSETNHVQEQHHWHKNSAFDGNKTIVGELFGKFFAQVYFDVMEIVMFEIFERAKMV
ncbi:hypothetical protein FACS1894169_13730 [Bacteroidia bacterium]|nr:hypothetical protein FACS1894169_13730 [Bacteroidia bacterium]